MASQEVVAQVSSQQLIRLVMKFRHDRHFSHTAWSIFQAEELEALAAQIRRGYAEDEARKASN